MESVTGYIYTHWDCPACDAVNEEEGDCGGQTVTCVDCGCEVFIGSSN